MKNLIAVTQEHRPATLVDWSMAPAWVSVDFAAFLTGLDAGAIDQAITLAGVDAIERGGETFWQKVRSR